MDAPLAFGMIGDFPLRIAEEIPIPVSIQILTSSLVFRGGLLPAFRRIFALCPVFTRWVGYLPYPREESGTQGRQRLLLVLHSAGGMCFTSVFSAVKANSASTATVFRICFQMRSSYTAETEKYISDADCGCATLLSRKKKCGFCRRRNDFSASTTLTTHNFYKASSAISFALCLSKHITRRDFPLIRMETVFCPEEVLMRSSSANAFSSPLGLMTKHSPCSSQSFRTILWAMSV